MNDRFKFRIWWKKENRYRVDTHIIPIGRLTNFANSDEYVIEQCTGLKDKNGNLIYEGDILLLHNDQFEVGNNGITVFFNCLTDKYIHIEPLDFDCADSEIIGNIHEQKETTNDK